MPSPVIAEVGTTVWRPPYAPISLGALAGRINEPTRVSVLQPWHEANGATPILAGQWVRPEHYGDPAAEVRAPKSRRRLPETLAIEQLDRLLDAKVAEGRPLTLDAVNARPLPVRLRDGVARLFSPYL